MSFIMEPLEHIVVIAKQGFRFYQNMTTEKEWVSNSIMDTAGLTKFIARSYTSHKERVY